MTPNLIHLCLKEGVIKECAAGLVFSKSMRKQLRSFTKCSFLSAYSRRLLQNQAKPVNLIRMKVERKNVMSKGVDFAKAQANASSL